MENYPEFDFKDHKDYVAIYDNYDKTFIDWCGTLKRTEQSLPRVFATPERAFAQMEKKLQLRMDQMNKEAPVVIPLPFMSIARTTKYDPSRFSNHPVRKWQYSKDIISR